jgi:D-sedoheptulose 7-phosphate isomerase
MHNQEYINAYIGEVRNCFQKLEQLAPEIGVAAAQLVECLANGGRLFLCGNGGSAADAQHIAAELVGRFKKERKALPAIALTTDTSAITAIANDYEFDRIFSRQLRGLARSGDMLVAISTSGNSGNILKAVDAASEMGVLTLALTGAAGGKLAQVCDTAVQVPSDETSHIQEMHIAVGHMLCAIVEDAL